MMPIFRLTNLSLRTLDSSLWPLDTEDPEDKKKQFFEAPQEMHGGQESTEAQESIEAKRRLLHDLWQVNRRLGQGFRTMYFHSLARACLTLFMV